jgi:hypothetical protein
MTLEEIKEILLGMPNNRLEAIRSFCSTELQDRRYRIWESKIENNIYVGEVKPEYREEYVEFLEDIVYAVDFGDNLTKAQDIYDEWRSQQEIMQSYKTTGA